MLTHCKPLPVRTAALLAATAFASAMAVTVASAPPANAAHTYSESAVTDNDVVNGGSKSISPDFCVSTDVYFQATWTFEGLPEVSYTASTYDRCAGEGTYVTGVTYNAILEFNGNQSAHVVATIPLTDYNGQPAGEVRIDNTFTGFGPAMPGHSKLEYNFDRSMLKVVSIGASREATTTGSIPLDFALITNGGSHTLLIIHDVPF